MKSLLLLFLGMLSSSFQVMPVDRVAIPAYEEKVVKDRLKNLKDPLFKPKYTRVVRAYIKNYTLYNRPLSERIIGRAQNYFPLFEKLLEEKGLPSALKYLPIVESALLPKASSRVGAGGLWQFMPYTAIEQGLAINTQLDERCDPHKSTKAALDYLMIQYERFKSWPLALAAYNGGPGRVRRAIRRGGSRNFWKIKRFLPRETRNYVSAYIAAAYLMEYYQEHELTPDMPALDEQLTTTISIHEKLDFYTIAQLTGLSLGTIQALNPSFHQNHIPASANGHFLCLPQRVMPAVQDYLYFNAKMDLMEHPVWEAPIVLDAPFLSYDTAYTEKIWYVDGRKTLQEIAQQLDCAPYHLRQWNAIPKDSIAVADTLLTFFGPKQLKRFNPLVKVDEVTPLDATVSMDCLNSTDVGAMIARTKIEGVPLYFAPSEKIRLRDIPTYLPEADLPTLMELNNMEPKTWIDAGQHIIIKRL
ncbi:MAG: transglycosylase SLT domain-containing protein [Bacteroidota bacterium]